MEEKLKHSILGVISTVFSFITIFVFGTVFFFLIFQVAYNHKRILPNTSEIYILGFAVIICSILALLGILLGIIGLFEKTKKKTFSFIGFFLSLLYFFIIGTLFLIGYYKKH